MSPVTVALVARLLVLLAVVVAGREIGRAVMRGAVAAAGAAVPSAAEGAHLIGVYEFPATLVALFIGVVAAQVSLHVWRSRSARRVTLWLSMTLALVSAVAAPALMWLRAGAIVTQFPDLMYGSSVALAGFLPPVAVMAAAAWWWVATTLPLPKKTDRRSASRRA